MSSMSVATYELSMPVAIMVMRFVIVVIPVATVVMSVATDF
jgi:hypothetical protein